MSTFPCMLLKTALERTTVPTRQSCLPHGLHSCFYMRYCCFCWAPLLYLLSELLSWAKPTRSVETSPCQDFYQLYDLNTFKTVIQKKKIGKNLLAMSSFFYHWPTQIGPQSRHSSISAWYFRRTLWSPSEGAFCDRSREFIKSNSKAAATQS